MSFEFVLLTLAAAIQAGTPILYATLGEIVTERSGVLNLGVEGMMIFGAFCGFLAAYATGSAWAGVLCGGLAGTLLAAVHGLVCLVFRGNQVVSGLALTILGTGLADFFGTPHVSRVTEGFSSFSLPVLGDIPVLGRVFFQQDVLVYLSYVLVPLVWFFLVRTRWGLALRAAGENPRAVAAAGLSPVRLRWVGVLLGGFLVGVGGAYLSLVALHQWTLNITAGRGWIAVALVVFAFWRPGRALLGAYLFGCALALQPRLQALDLGIPSDVLHMSPYLLTLLVLLVSSVRGGGRAAPAALGVNLEPGA